jgi:hypothetical protein
MMASMLRWLLGLLVAAGIAATVLYVAAGRGAPPVIEIGRPDRAVGQKGTLSPLRRPG